MNRRVRDLPRKKQLAPATFDERIQTIARVLDEFQGGDIVLMDLRGICDFADGFVIATARSRTHMQALLHNLLEHMREQGMRPINNPERDYERWALIDFADVVVHLFEAQARSYYDLEGLWADARITQWSQAAMA
jgi:ribosome-associated protein